MDSWVLYKVYRQVMSKCKDLAGSLLHPLLPFTPAFSKTEVRSYLSHVNLLDCSLVAFQDAPLGRGEGEISTSFWATSATWSGSGIAVTRQAEAPAGLCLSEQSCCLSLWFLHVPTVWCSERRLFWAGAGDRVRWWGWFQPASHECFLYSASSAGENILS